MLRSLLAAGVVAMGVLLAQDPQGDAVAAAKAQLDAGRQQFRDGNLDAAQGACSAALAVFEQNLPAADLPASEAHLVLGAIAGLRHENGTAALHYRRGLDLRAAHEPAGAPYVQLLRFNLAATLQAQLDNDAALPLAEAGLAALAEKQQRAALAGNLHAVAALALDGLGRYRDALDHYGKALAILTPTYGAKHSDVLRLRGLEGVMMCRIGRVAEGLQQLDASAAALAADQAAPVAFKREIDCARAAMHLIYDLDESAAALVKAQLAIAIDESRRGRPGAASSLILLMAALAPLREISFDLELLHSALDRMAAELGDDHPLTAIAMANVARIHHWSGDRVGEVVWLDRAVAILERNPGYFGADRWQALWNHLLVHWEHGERDVAAASARRILAELPRLLGAWVAPFDDAQRRALTATARKTVDVAVQLAAEMELPPSEVWQPVLTWRALVARGFLQSLQWLQDHRDAGSQALADELRSAMAEVTRLQRDGTAAARLPAAVARRDAASERLLQRLAERAPAVPAAGAIAKGLAPDEVLIDFYSHVHVASAQGPEPTLEERLLAFVVRRAAAPVIVDVGPVADVTPALETFLRAVARWTTPTPTAARTIGVAGERLAQRVWAPLRHLVPAGARVIVCPDSVLALVPWACLPGAREGTFLVEEHAFSQVADPAELLTRREWSALPRDAKLVTVGGVAYGTDAFAPLPHSGEEVAAVATAFGAAGGGATGALAGDEATPERFTAAVAGAAFVHVATHGWFRGASTAPDMIRIWQQGLAPNTSRTEQPGDCGIALARATLASDELAALDLGRCELAVLSACETGLGTVTAGEGLLGLRRSLRLAGARRSVTTLWRVDDAATARFMTDFYEALWRRREPPQVALRSAQLALLAALRAGGGQARTGLWGGFVLEGR